ncbi:MAG: hypothetical protein GY830_04995 [Bacteroidetes bacterium]|nr:hypothetical protein [Bacteroidota bacterium]
MLKKNILIFFTLLSSCKLKPIQQYEAKKTFVLYTIAPGANKQLKKIMDSNNISIRHSDEGKVYIRTKKDSDSDPLYYHISRSEEKGLHINDRISEITHPNIEELFKGEGNEPSDALFYKENKDVNLKFEASDVRFFVLNESSTSKDKNLEGHKFHSYIIKLQYEDDKLMLRHVKVKSLIDELKNGFTDDQVSYIIKYIFKSEKYLVKAGLNPNISKNGINITDEDKEKIQMLVGVADYYKDKKKKDLKEQVLYKGEIKKWFTTKVDKGIYVMIETKSGSFLKAFELQANFKDYNNEEHLAELKQQRLNTN